MIKPEPFNAQSRADTAAARTATTDSRYRRSQVYGLLLIAAVILAAALLRAQAHILFPPGWWR